MHGIVEVIRLILVVTAVLGTVALAYGLLGYKG